MPAVFHVSISLVLWGCFVVLIVTSIGGVALCLRGHADAGVPLIASGLITFVVAGAQAEIENDRNLQADRQTLELAFAQTKDLTSADFSHRDLHSFYIAYKVMPFVLLDGSDLSLARFRCDNLELDNFASPGSQSAVVSGATFTGDDLGSADFQGSNLQNAHLTLVIGTPIPNSQRQTDFQGADLRKAIIFNATLIRLDARGARLAGATLYDVDLRHAQLEGVSLRGATMGGSAYPRSSLKPGKAGLGPVDLRGANLENAQLEGADLRGAYLFGARLDGATADAKTKLPHGFGLSPDGRDHVVQLARAPRSLPPVPRPQSPCPVLSRPARFG